MYRNAPHSSPKMCSHAQLLLQCLYGVKQSWSSYLWSEAEILRVEFCVGFRLWMLVWVRGFGTGARSGMVSSLPPASHQKCVLWCSTADFTHLPPLCLLLYNISKNSCTMWGQNRYVLTDFGAWYQSPLITWVHPSNLAYSLRIFVCSFQDPPSWAGLQCFGLIMACFERDKLMQASLYTWGSNQIGGCGLLSYYET